MGNVRQILRLHIAHCSFFCYNGSSGMIQVTRLDGREYFINPHQIECIEVRPDTTLVMLSGKSHIVREEVDTVLSKIDAYRRRLNLLVVQE